jgi:alkylation response protein AidB-like acyl-CoA dehydrogenase
MVTGEWTGTTNLTEPQAGSDVGAVATRAVPADDGSGDWRISGQKIFITYGEQDLTANIVHLVLARVSGVPPGTKGILCFIVPKYVLDADRLAGATTRRRASASSTRWASTAAPPAPWSTMVP